VSKGKLYSTLVLNLLLYGCENWVLRVTLRQRLNTFHNRCVRAMARARRTSFSSTNDHPAPFVKRPALAPMYTALGLTSLDLVISNRKLRWAGHVRRMDWSRLPRKFLTAGAQSSCHYLVATIAVQGVGGAPYHHTNYHIIIE
jgi:hypothetical protein